MIINIRTNIYVEVADEEEAENACIALGALDSIMNANLFPHGDVIEVGVDRYEKLTDAQISERGFEE